MLNFFKNKLLSVLLICIILFSFSTTVKSDNIQPIFKSIFSDIFISGIGAGGFIDVDKILLLNSTKNITEWNEKYDGIFERIGDMHVFDFEARLVTAPANTPAIYGGRKAANLAKHSRDLSNEVYVPNVNATLPTANTFLASALNGQFYQLVDTIEGHEYRFSITASVASGQTSNYRLYFGVSVPATANIQLSSTPTRYSAIVNGRVGDGNVLFGFRDGNSTNFATVTITDFQVEDITGQSNKNPSAPILTTSSAITEFYNTENNQASAIDVVKNRVIGNYPNGGCAIGDSQTDNTKSFSLLLNACLDSTVTNQGVGSETLTDIEARFLVDADPATQSFVIIQGGINDLFNASSDPNTVMRSKIESMAAMCVANSCAPMFINISPWGNYTTWNTDRQTWTESFNTWLSNYCTTNGYYLLDVYTLLGDPINSEELYTNFDTIDGLHWTDSADVLIGSTFLDYFALTATTDTIPLENVIMLATHPSTTNVVPLDEYRDFSHANWIKTNGSITAGDVVLIDGTTVADKNTFTASAGNATIIKTQYTSASGVHSGGMFVKRKTGTGTVEVCIDNGTTWVDVTTHVDSDAGWHLTETTLPTVANPQLGLRLVTSEDAVYLEWSQIDDGYARVSSHPIRGGETLGSQDFHFDNDGLISDTKGSVYAEAMLLPDDFAMLYIPSIVNNGAMVLGSWSPWDWAATYDKSMLSYLAGGMSGYSKVVAYWWDTSKQVSANGLSSAGGIYDGAYGTGAIYIGGVAGRATTWNGGIAKITFDPEPHDSTYWETETEPDCYVAIGNELVRDNDGVVLTDNDGDCIWAPR